MKNRMKLLSIAMGIAATGMVTGCGVAPSVQTPPLGPLTASNQWTWVGGSNLAGQAGIYGSVGIKSAASMPGARGGSAGWTDTAGNLWLFGGEAAPVGAGCDPLAPACVSGTNTWLNDLWKFDGSAWTWMGGSNGSDQSGVYGTQGVVAAANVPGARYGAVSWSDADGDLWLFGGSGYDSAGNAGLLNDLWKYSGAQWTWVGGSAFINSLGTYGTLGVATPGNTPGGRSHATGAADKAGNVWLFGGTGCDAVHCDGAAQSDLWRYSGGQWTWESGENSTYPTEPGLYGTQGIAAPGNYPGGRYSTGGWVDASGSLWIFGGVGWGSTVENLAELNDLWSYSGGEWTWTDGTRQAYPDIDVLGTYGTQGVPAPANIPGSRDSGMSWTDTKGDLWFFGGEGFGMNANGGYYNDLWKYSGGLWSWVAGSGTGGQAGTYGTEGMAAAGNAPGGRIDAMTWTDASGNLWMFGGAGRDATGTGGYLNDLWEYQP